MATKAVKAASRPAPAVAKAPVVIPVITLRKPPAPWLGGLDEASVSALRGLYALALNAFEGRITAAEIEAVSVLRMRPYVGQYKAELLEWLGRP